MASAWEWSGLAAAATLVVAVALAARWSSDRPVPSPREDALGSAVRVSHELGARAVEDEYQRAEAAFLAALEARRDRLSPESRARVDASLRLIDEALDEPAPVSRRRVTRREPRRRRAAGAEPDPFYWG